MKNARLAQRNPAAYAQMKADEAAKMPTLLDKESAMRIAQEKGWVILFNESTGIPRGVHKRGESRPEYDAFSIAAGSSSGHRKGHYIGQFPGMWEAALAVARDLSERNAAATKPLPSRDPSASSQLLEMTGDGRSFGATSADGGLFGGYRCGFCRHDDSGCSLLFRSPHFAQKAAARCFEARVSSASAASSSSSAELPETPPQLGWWRHAESISERAEDGTWHYHCGWMHAGGTKCNWGFPMAAKMWSAQEDARIVAHEASHALPMTAEEALDRAKPRRHPRKGNWHFERGYGTFFDDKDDDQHAHAKYFYEMPAPLELPRDDDGNYMDSYEKHAKQWKQFRPHGKALAALLGAFTTAEECALWVARYRHNPLWLPPPTQMRECLHL